MNKKVLILAVLFFVIFSASAFSWGLGVAFGLNALGDLPGPGIMLSGKVDQLPFLFGVGLTISETYFNLGVTADWHFLRENLTGILNYYIGAGAFIGVGTNNFALGARLPLALYIFPIEKLEVFLELAPALGIGFNPVRFPTFNIQGALGFRYWFD